MKCKSNEQARIDRENDKTKKYLQHSYPICIFCGGLCRNGDLAHKVPRSYTSSRWSRFELQTMYQNVGLAHRECHEIYDNDMQGAKLLPRYYTIMEEIKAFEPEYAERRLARYG